MRYLAIALAAMSATAPAEVGAGPIERYRPVVSRMVKAINAGDYDGIRRDFAQVMREALPPAKLVPFFKGMSSTYGRIVKLEAGRFVPPLTAVFPARFERGVLDIKIVLDQNDKIVGLWFLPHAAALPVPERHETKLWLPFSGSWLVFWGGDTRELNQHHDVPNQRYAFDFLVVDKKGETHKGQGKSNEDYHAFGKPILAPADGVVTDVIRGVRDNVPGSMNPYSALGNAVIVRHLRYEVSVFAHLKLGSIKVKVADRIKAGQIIGLCGNSGNSSEPHLHYHLQNTPVIQDGTGIKCRFANVVVRRNGTKQTRRDYSPVKGDIVRSEQVASEKTGPG